MSERSLADRLFGESPAAPTAAAAATTSRTLEAPTPTAASETPRRSLADRLFADTLEQGLDLGDDIERLVDHLEWDGDTQAAAQREFADLVTELGLERSDAKVLHALWTDARVKGDTDAWLAQVEQWPTQARRAVREQFGVVEGEELLRKWDAYVEAHPNLKAVLYDHGVGSHPKVVTMLAEHVRRLGTIRAAD